MTPDDVAAPLHETGNRVEEQILVNGGKPFVTKAALRGPVVVQDGPAHKDTDQDDGDDDDDDDDDDIPESQPTEITMVEDVQPMSRQKTGFEPNPYFSDSFVGMPMDNTGITSGPPPAPPPTPNVTHSKYYPSKEETIKTRAMARRELQENVETGATLAEDADPEDVNNTAASVDTEEAKTPPRGPVKRCHSKVAEGGPPAFSNNGSPRSFDPQPTPLPWPKGTLWDYDCSRYIDEHRRKHIGESRNWLLYTGK